jgi:hypothetical protein
MTNEQETQAVEAHLQVCARCREELEHLESLRHMMQELKLPPVRDSAVQDLHQRLLVEQRRDKPVVIAMGRKPKWIAGVAAGLLMAVSIYASGLVPGANLALWFKADEKDSKPSVAIEEPMPSWDNTDSEKEDNNPTEAANPEKDPSTPADNEIPEEPGSKDQPDTNNSNTEVPASNVTPDPIKVNVPRIAQSCSTRVMVEDTGDSLARIVQIADVGNGIEFVSTSNNSSAQIMSATSTREVVFKVNKSQLNSFLSQLGNLGHLTTPIYDQIVLTEEFSSIENKISGLEQDIQSLESESSISTEDQAKLTALKQQLKDSHSQKGQLEKELNTVNITVYLVQNVNP